MGKKETALKDLRFGEGEDFVRVRRITGYLTGSLGRWNSAKQAEERDRVKHFQVSKMANSYGR